MSALSMTAVVCGRGGHQNGPATWSTDRLREDLSTGIRLGELVPWYQPVVDATSGGLVSVEALVRWLHPEHGLVGPAEFVPRLEAEGGIHLVGAAILRAAGAAAAQWPSVAGRFPAVRVNVSPRQLDDHALVGAVGDMLTRTGLDPNRLTLEITESAPIDRLGVTQQVCRRLAVMGVRLSLDDFGAAHSDLVRLAQLPCHEIKVDKALLYRVTVDPDRWQRLADLILLAGALGLDITVEGVETRQQAAALRDLARDHNVPLSLQGYLFGVPAPMDAAALLAADRVGRRMARADHRADSQPATVIPLLAATPTGGQPANQSTGPGPVGYRPTAPGPARPRVARTPPAPR